MDKEIERAALQVALPTLNIRSVHETESPDFVVLVGNHVLVGIEVTELWASETEARPEHVPGYVQELIDGKVRHRDDKQNVTVVQRAEVTRPGGRREVLGPGIVTQYPDGLRHMDLIAEAIERKSQKHPKYAKPLHGYELVIVDRIPWGRVPARPIPASALLPQRLREAMRKCPFHDVTILGLAEGDRKFRLSLRAVELAERVAQAMHVAGAPLGRNDPPSMDRLATLALLAFAGHSDRIAKGYVNTPEALRFGRFWVERTDEEHFVISGDFERVPSGIVVPEWPSDIGESDRKKLTDLMERVPPASPWLSAIEDITDELTGSILL